MKNKELVRTVANVTGLTDAEVQDVLRTTAEVVAESLSRDFADVPLPGFGKFRPGVRWNSRMQRVCTASFLPSKPFQRAVNGSV